MEDIWLGSVIYRMTTSMDAAISNGDSSSSRASSSSIKLRHGKRLGRWRAARDSIASSSGTCFHI